MTGVQTCALPIFYLFYFWVKKGFFRKVKVDWSLGKEKEEKGERFRLFWKFCFGNTDGDSE